MFVSIQKIQLTKGKVFQGLNLKPDITYYEWGLLNLVLSGGKGVFLLAFDVAYNETF